MAYLNTISTAVAVGIATSAVLYIVISRNKPNDKLLLKLPLIADLHSSPITRPLENWDAWAQKQGPIVATKLFGIVPIVILNSSKAATELFSRRSQWYSNRPPSTSMEMITGAGPGQSRFTLMHDYDAHLKLHHRLLSPSLGPVAAPRYMPLMELESKQLLKELMDILKPSSDGIISTKAVYPLLERAQSSVILALHYGLRIQDFSEPILHEIIDTQVKVTYLAANPGLPDMLPFLRHLPTFISPWQRYADDLFAEQADLYTRLLEHGKSSPGWNATKQAILTAEKHAPSGVPDIDLAFTLATSIQGGMETSPRQVLWLFVAALQNPDFLTRAHEVLDAVVGRDRLPQFTDRPELVYIDAVIHELFRWRPISPGSIPRRADKSDEYSGVRIAKNAVIVANAWGIGRDDAVFDPALGDLQSFHPERWLQDDTDEKGPSKIRNELPLPVFGQGRRSCLGKRVAVDGTFMQVANLLWAFDVEPVDEVNPWDMVVVGFMTEPKEFRFRLKPRGPWVAGMIERSWQNSDKGLDKVMGASADVEA
ncbi:cytochrome P450 [Plectosphaerella plurivora]|uniref:Cytochrome P450 n=1 Tax=Plectosphaerella plurivora TaxID=936078 RepID=A0A9P8VDI1_9PEZI|nr:cytochrome P450 [Plectosphaerella plurivora]